MANIGLILLVFAFVIACVAVRMASVGGWNLLPLSVALWIASELVGGLGRVTGIH